MERFWSIHPQGHRSVHRRRAAAAATIVVGLTASAPAAAATLHVETTGTDSTTCGAVATPCASPARAVANAVSGDSVRIGAGTFPVTTAIVVNTKDLDIGGAGSGATILDGQDTTTLGSNGMLQFGSSGNPQPLRTQVVHDLGFRNVGRNGTAASIRRFSIVARNRVALTVRDVAIAGSDDARDTGVDSSNNSGTILVERLTTTTFSGNSVLLERHTGPATVRDSDFGSSAGDYGVFAYSWGATFPVSGRFAITDNVFRGANGIGVWAPFTGLADAGFRGGFEIARNRFDSTATTGNAIGVTNYSTAADGGSGGIDDLAIHDNDFRGAGAGAAINLVGRSKAPSITQNVIRGYARGVALGLAAAGHGPTGAVVRLNQIVDNATAGIANGTPDGVDATDNWWGCNAGPGTPGCDATTGPGAVMSSPRIVLGLSATPTSLGEHDSADATADLRRNSDGVAPGSVFADGFPVAFSGDAGTIAASAPLASGTATTGFTSAARSGRVVRATVDHQTVAFPFPDLAPPTTTTTSTTTTDPGPGPTTPTTPPPPARPDPTTLTANEQLLACSTRPLVLIDVVRASDRTRISGTTAAANRGRLVEIRGAWSTRPLATLRVAADGRFAGRVPLPPTALRTGYREGARYLARLGDQRSLSLKLQRRLLLTATSGRGRVTASGRVIGPLARRASDRRVTIWRADGCGGRKLLGHATPGRDGRFRLTVAAAADARSFVLRAGTRIRGMSSSRVGPTRSLAVPVTIRH